MRKQTLSRAMGWVICGYVVGLLDFDMLGFPLSLYWLSYLFFLIALPTLAAYAPSAALLRNFAVILALYNGVQWVVMDLFKLVTNISMESPWMLVGMIGILISVYFHFQLFTSLAEIAEQYELKEEDNLLTTRNLYVVFSTVLVSVSVMVLPESLIQPIMYIILAVSVIFFVIVIWILKLLISLRRSLKRLEIDRKV